MKIFDSTFSLNVTSEIGSLKCLIIHSPDRGLGKVVPSKAQDWLFEDIVHLETIRKKEYDLYLKILLYFLDPTIIKGKLPMIDAPENNRSFYKPQDKGFHSSSKVLEFQLLLSDILEEETIRHQMVAAVCAIEDCPYHIQQLLANTEAKKLSEIFISGTLQEEMIFAPIPNLIFTRDLGVVINDHLLLNKPTKKARSRESFLARYIVYNHPIFKKIKDNVIEIPNTSYPFLRPDDEIEGKTTLEGGDVMVVNSNHVLIGWSERTSASGINGVIKVLFERNLVEKVTVIKIPHKRDFMHIDTLFTQVKKNMWVILGSVSKDNQKAETPIDYLSDNSDKNKIRIFQFKNPNNNNPKEFSCLEDLLSDISENDLGSNEKTEFIYSGHNIFPFDAREQWTDACNVLAIKEGVVLGYDRNDKTIDAFIEKGFTAIPADELIRQFESGEVEAHRVKDTIIMLPSAELSRARGGFHCMSFPLYRDNLT